MSKHNLNDLLAFMTVSREGSFTRAAAQLGVTQSAISQTVSGLEARLNIRLLTRTTRSLSLTVAGERLVQAIGSRFDEIESELDALTELRDKPAGTVRISCGDSVLKTILLPKLMPVLEVYPDIKLEFNINYGLTDIVADRFDAGVRFSEALDKDMIAVRIGSDVRMAVVAAPSYFKKNPIPKSPHDLISHRCINIRFPTYGGVDVWEFERRGQKLKIRVDGQLIFNTTPHITDAALGGTGIAYLPEAEFAPHIEEGRLTRVLEQWCPPFSGYHLYYPSRKQSSPAFSIVVEALRLK
ncbi:MAG: LysR family transcriptional regulator [Pseudomonadota bacterium]